MNVIRFFALALALVAFVLVPAANSQDQPPPASNVPKAFNFVDFVTKFNKDYAPTEAMHKAQLFFSRTMNIFKHNVQYVHHNVGHFLNQNQYIDMDTDEVKRTLIADESELKPVQESLVSPDMPADDYHQATSDGINDGMSQGGPAQPLEPSVRFIDFFGLNDNVEKPPTNTDEQLNELRKFSREIKSQYELADEVSRLVEADKTVQDEEQTLQKIRRMRKIETKLNPKTDNKNYDPSLIPSQAGWGNTRTDFSRAFASELMGDFGDSLDPYPMPEIPTGPVLPGTVNPNHNQPLTMGNLLSLVRDVYGIFSSGNNEEVVSDVEEQQANNGPSQDDLMASQVAHSSNVAPILAPVDQNNPSANNLGSNQMHLQQLAMLQKGPVQYDIDWRRTGCVPRAKSQLNCNACYVFAALDLMEFFHCLQTKKFTEFSAQYVVDCGHKTQLNGCQGGKLSNVGIFIKQYGIQSYAMYPYTGAQQQCPFGPEADAQQKSYMFKPQITRWKLHSDINAWYEWLPKTPMIVGINMPADFLAYGGGIHDGQDCVPGMVHAMVLVGSGVQDGQTFWLLKNTFSYAWGEGGYFRLSKRAPLKCFNSAIVAKVKF